MTAKKSTKKSTAAAKPKKLTVKDVSKLKGGAAGCTTDTRLATCSGPGSSTGTQGANCPGCSVVAVSKTRS